MTESEFPKEFLERLQAVIGKRARIVIDHILEHGLITTEELEQQYGYKHPPRAARDVREQGIPLETFSVKSTDGRTIAAYRFADPLEVRHGKIGGRRTFSKEFKSRLYEDADGRCAICNGIYEARYLQIDHCVPYEVAGDSKEHDERDPQDYMLLCGSCNRAKSWSCEHCANWQEAKDASQCKMCYWANLENYAHIALQPVRRLDVIWTDEEITVYDALKQQAESIDEPMPDYVKAILKKYALGADHSSE